MSDEGALAQKPITVMTALQMTADRYHDNDAFGQTSRITQGFDRGQAGKRDGWQDRRQGRGKFGKREGREEGRQGRGKFGKREGMWGGGKEDMEEENGMQRRGN